MEDFYTVKDSPDRARVFLHKLPIAFASCSATHPFALWLGEHTEQVQKWALSNRVEYVQALAVCATLDGAKQQRAITLQALQELADGH